MSARSQSLRLARVLLAVMVLSFVPSSLVAGERIVSGSGASVDVPEPEAGEIVRVIPRPGQTLRLDFDVMTSEVRTQGSELLFLMHEGGVVVVERLLEPDLLESGITIEVAGTAIPAAQFVAAFEQVMTAAEPPASEPTGGGTPPAAANGDAGGIIHTGREFLFAGEGEGQGYGLYSYLLFQRNDQAGLGFERRSAALEGYLTEIDEVDDLEVHAVSRSDINVLYLPVQPVSAAGDRFQDMRSFIAQLDHKATHDLLLDHYDFVRARLLLGNLRLGGDGPYIVTHEAPLGTGAVFDRNRLIVQDLSRVPPALVRLWVIEFKRQIAEHRSGEPSLRPLALRLRTEIANIANAFSVTREAVAGFIEIAE